MFGSQHHKKWIEFYNQSLYAYVSKVAYLFSLSFLFFFFSFVLKISEKKKKLQACHSPSLSLVFYLSSKSIPSQMLGFCSLSKDDESSLGCSKPKSIDRCSIHTSNKQLWKLLCFTLITLTIIRSITIKLIGTQCLNIIRFQCDC